jgi:hypothetical protein
VPPGNPRVDRLLNAEAVVRDAGGSVVRLAGAPRAPTLPLVSPVGNYTGCCLWPRSDRCSLAELRSPRRSSSRPHATLSYLGLSSNHLSARASAFRHDGMAAYECGRSLVLDVAGGCTRRAVHLAAGCTHVLPQGRLRGGAPGRAAESHPLRGERSMPLLSNSKFRSSSHAPGLVSPTPPLKVHDRPIAPTRVGMIEWTSHGRWKRPCLQTAHMAI